MTRKRNCYGPAPEIRGRVHSYWLQQKKIRESRRKRQAPSGKRQAASNKPQIEILKLERDEWRQAAVSLEEARDRWRKLYEQTLAIAVQVTDE